MLISANACGTSQLRHLIVVLPLGTVSAGAAAIPSSYRCDALKRQASPRKQDPVLIHSRHTCYQNTYNLCWHILEVMELEVMEVCRKGLQTPNFAASGPANSNPQRAPAPHHLNLLNLHQLPLRGVGRGLGEHEPAVDGVTTGACTAKSGEADFGYTCAGYGTTLGDFVLTTFSVTAEAYYADDSI